MSPTLRLEPAPAQLPEDPLAFLESLGGPVAWRSPGRDRSRARVVTTLLHGNEPSGFLAVHALLRSGFEPAVDTVWIIANVEAARIHPVFTHRSVPGRRDLNRCFLGPFDDVEGRLARALLDRVAEIQPEALLDCHNNTGRNPPYGVGLEPTPEALALTALFGRHFVWSHLQLGALLEAVSGCPALTVEVGRSGDDAANRTAREGLERFLGRESPFAGGDEEEVRVLRMPMRARLREGRSLAIAERPRPGSDLTLPDYLDRHNFETVPTGAILGWVEGSDCPLELVDEAGRERSAEYFALDGGRLVARRPFTPIMITVDAAVAASDCVFYVVQEIAEEIGRGVVA